MLFTSKDMVKITLSMWLVSGYAHVMILVSVVIVTLPLDCSRQNQPTA